MLRITVHGSPAPQGSKRYLGQRGGKGITVESSRRVAPWRADVRDAALTALDGQHQELWETPLSVTVTFVLDRPRSHYRTGRNAHLLRDGAPNRPGGRPDVDKLARAVLDALTGIVWRDDSQIVHLSARKTYGQPHAQISIRRIT